MGFGSAIGGLFSGLASMYSADKSNQAIKQQLKAQARENEKTRQYNLMLAKKQNAWNVEQWNRENEYNSPAQQKARLEAAGLNADMMYGGSGVQNTAASSPDMTSGAPATPMDWSSLANKKTIGSAIADALSYEMARAQINDVKANTKKTLADAGLSDIALEYADAQARLGLKIGEQEYEKAKQDYERGVQAIDRNAAELEGISLDNAYKAIRNAFESEVFQNQIKVFAQELKIKEAEAKHALEYYAAQLLGVKADNAWKDAAWIVEQKNGIPTLIKYGSESLTKLVDVLVNYIPSPKKKGGKSITINNNIPVPKK